jgi:EAL domain-containing protein (putative c-di-GMP-specific phosphodiesterase class I)/GGDEF domain-containing protein
MLARESEWKAVEEVSAVTWGDGYAVQPFFQPIVDLTSGLPLGYEVLSRGTPPFEMPDRMFRHARETGLLWDLERACRTAALLKIASLPPSARQTRFFLNVSPQILSDPRFAQGFTLDLLRELGIDQDLLVIEITENEAVLDFGRFEELIHHYADQGFRIALDDFGSGHSSLVVLLRTLPHFIKLDQAVVRDVDRTPYKQQLVRALVAFSTSVGTRLIAEGVETWRELEALLRLGIRYAQGFLFAYPQPEPEPPASPIRDRLVRLGRAAERWSTDPDEDLAALVSPCVTVESGTLSVEGIDLLFRQTPEADHVVLLRQRRPVGLIPRIYFYTKTAGPFGYPVFQRKPGDVLAKRNPLAVEEKSRVTTLYKLAMDRPAEDLYDPVLVVDADGALVGTVTIRQLIQRSTELEIQWATGANPLTGLPGNGMIQRWIREALELPRFAIVYADLDRFKEYNDCYGFLRGDEMIRATGRILTQGMQALSTGARLGHVGGDDFVLVCGGRIEESALAEICREFDQMRNGLFDPLDRDRGFFLSRDRRHQTVEVPLVTLSLAVVDSRDLAIESYLDPARLARLAAALKTTAKALTERERRSAFVFD